MFSFPILLQQVQMTGQEMIQMQQIESAGFLLAISAIAAGLALLPAASTAFGQGYVAGKAVEAIGRNPEARGDVSMSMIIGCAIAETGGIYGLLVALLIMFANPFFTLFTAFVG